MKGGMLCREEMEEDHREQEQEQAAAGDRVLPIQGRLKGPVTWAVPVRGLRLAVEAGAGLLAEAAVRALAISRR